MGKNRMFKFNIKNVKYAIRNDENDYESPEDLAYANSLSLEPTYEETTLYGDGEVLAILGDDKGKEGTLDVINIEDDYEIDMGRARELEDGTIADVQQRKSQYHAIYYEVEAVVDGEVETIKNWLLKCTTGKASETYEQTEGEPTVNTYEYSLKVMGEPLRDNADEENYKDENGNEVKVFRMTSYPDDDNYDGFEDEVPVPKDAA